MKAIYKAPWVDPAEELPLLGERVLICREKEPGELLVEQAWLTQGGWWKVFGTNCKRIIAWRPMPEGPEVNEDVAELKPCPFCGKAPRVRSMYAPDHGTYMFVIECFTSPRICVRPITRWCFTEKEAAEQWNRRDIQ